MKNKPKKTLTLIGTTIALSAIFSILPSNLSVPQTISAKAENLAEDYQHKVNADGETVTITGYSGTSENVVIPSSIDGKDVTNIAPYAFAKNMTIKSVVFPDTLKTIGEEEVDISDEIIKTPVGMSFMHCRNLQTVILNDGLEEIGAMSFFDCPLLEEVKIPDSTEIILFSAFGIYLDSSVDPNDQNLNINILALENFFVKDGFTVIGEKDSVADTYVKDTNEEIKGLEKSGLPTKNSGLLVFSDKNLSSSENEYNKKLEIYKNDRSLKIPFKDFSDGKIKHNDYVYLTGDADGNGEFNLADVITFKKAFLGIEDKSLIVNMKNEDTEPDLSDIVILKKMLLGFKGKEYQVSLIEK